MRCAIASCDVRVRTHFVETCDVRVRGVFLGLQCVIATLHIFFSNNARNDNRNYISFGVNYNSVAHELRILAIKAIFD